MIEYCVLFIRKYVLLLLQSKSGDFSARKSIDLEVTLMSLDIRTGNGNILPPEQP